MEWSKPPLDSRGSPNKRIGRKFRGNKPKSGTVKFWQNPVAKVAPIPIIGSVRGIRNVRGPGVGG